MITIHLLQTHYIVYCSTSGTSQGSAHLDCNVLSSQLVATDVNLKLVDIRLASYNESNVLLALNK